MNLFTAFTSAITAAAAAPEKPDAAEAAKHIPASRWLSTAASLDLPDAVVPLPPEPAARARLEAAFLAGTPWLCIRSDLQLMRVHAAPFLPRPAATADHGTPHEWHSESPGFSLADYPPPPVLWETGVSTAANGLGEEPNSYRTPRGWHAIAEKFGDGEPEGAEFKSRKPTGRVYDPAKEPSGIAWSADLILTRILWLDGLEEANRTSHERYIYFHGTNHEDRIGTPASQGCIRLRNKEMLRLYDMAPVGMPVLII